MGVLSVVMGGLGLLVLGAIVLAVVGGFFLESDKAKANAYLAHEGKK